MKSSNNSLNFYNNEASTSPEAVVIYNITFIMLAKFLVALTYEAYNKILLVCLAISKNEAP